MRLHFGRRVLERGSRELTRESVGLDLPPKALPFFDLLHEAPTAA